MANVVNKRFQDKETKQIYDKGDLYEHENVERVTFLIEQGFLKEEEIQIDYPKHTGGSWYQLSNGEKVQGKEEAELAEKELSEKEE